MKNQKIYVPDRGYLSLGTKRRVIQRKVPKDFYGECNLSQLPSNGIMYFKVVKKDGTLSKKIYVKDRDSYNRSTRKYNICSVDDVWGSGREMSGKTRVSTRFTY